MNPSRRRPRTACYLALAIGLLLAVPVHAAEPAAAKDALARRIVAGLKVRKGIALDLGCGDASLAQALALHTELVITCVDPERSTVERARRALDAASLYGTRVAVSQGSLTRLEYPSCCAALVVCGDEFVNGQRDRDLRELFRVLSPNGVAWLGQSAAAAQRGQALTRRQLEDWLREANIRSYDIIEEDGVWARITRPRESGWDEWTHRSHDAANTYGSNDTVAGPAFKPHWVSDYRPGLSSAAVAVAGGRVVLASLSYDPFPQTTPHIQVLDAYTGGELWARVGKKELPITRPPSMYSNRESCSDIAVVGDDLYLLGGKFCHVFDLATGALKQSLPVPREAEAGDAVWLYLSCVGDFLYGAVGQPPGVKTDWNTMQYRGVSKAVFALDRRDGRLRWISRAPASVCSLAVGGGSLYCCDAELKLHALDAQTGKERWSSVLNLPAGSEIAGCTYYRNHVWMLYNRSGLKDRKGNELRGAALLTEGHNKREVDAYSAETGQHRFHCDFGMTIAGVSFAGGLVFGSGQHGGEGVSVLDADTGALRWKARDTLKCTPSLGSPNCFFSQRGSYPSILDLKSVADLRGDAAKAERASFTGFRPSCSYPGVPANGMVYIQAEGCACASPIRGNIALIPGPPPVLDSTDRLRRGAAFDQPIVKNDDRTWATWRGDIRHSGRVDGAGPEDLTLLWKKTLPGRPTSLAVGRGHVFCGSSDHKFRALDAASGEPRWQYIAEGRIRTAPFLDRGRVYLSDDAGWAYCLRADHGDVIWQYRAALGAERIVGYGSLMSRWPAGTGVVVEDDTAYFAAGLFPDEGTAVYAVNARTGAPLWHKEFNTNRKGSRTAGFVPDGAMALANHRLYIPSGAGVPWQIELDDPEHKTSFTPGYHVKGHHIMVVDRDLHAVTPGLEFVHHVHYAAGEGIHRLPVVTDDTVYFLLPPTGKDGPCVAAGKRAAFQLAQNRAVVFTVKKDWQGTPWRWKAWPNVPMTAIIVVGGTIFTGGDGKVFATRAADGAAVWSAAVPGRVDDLAFHEGRLFVLCDSGTLLGFGGR